MFLFYWGLHVVAIVYVAWYMFIKSSPNSEILSSHGVDTSVEVDDVVEFEAAEASPKNKKLTHSTIDECEYTFDANNKVQKTNTSKESPKTKETGSSKQTPKTKKTPPKNNFNRQTFREDLEHLLWETKTSKCE